MTEGRCVPVQVALRLIDSSSLGLANRYQQFRQTNQDLQSLLKSIVNGKLLCVSMASHPLIESAQSITKASIVP